MNPYVHYSAMELARMLRSREVTSRDVVEAHIDHIQRVNPILNAVVKDRFEEARTEAKAADQRLQEEDASTLPPLLGVPCTIKESFQFRGMPQTSGHHSRRDHYPDEDAVTVKRLRDAGAIPLGVTNVPELCMWMETHNEIYGRTNNPYDPTRIVGGSSGGEGAIVGSGASPFGLGSDVGGSIRGPAFFNGVWGHKASGGLVPATGQYPQAQGRAARFLSTGPLCRRAEDLMPLLRILAGPDGKDDSCEEMELGDPSQVDLRQLRVLDVRGDGLLKVHPDLLEAQARVARHLEERGAVVIPTTFEQLRHSVQIWSSMLSGAQERSIFRKMMGFDRTRDVLHQMMRWPLRRSPHTLPALVLSLLDDVGHAFPKAAKKAQKMGEALKKDIIQAMFPMGVMLYPSYVRPAPRHRVPLTLPIHWSYTAIINVLELPATQVPLGLNQSGLPLGVQVVGLPGQDHVTISVAQELEKAFGGWVFPEWQRRLFV
ncbi:MAG: amidase [Myxococcales bacterium]|nr:amidase [Myxococcales bacterium]